tara:strand:- start:12200 stop:13393 length:1194 start_codon:yes stop_codon:yes gene_type:complete
MANYYGADVLASLNRILQYRQQREQTKVSESLSMLKMAQDQRNLDRSFQLEEAQLGIGGTELAKEVRANRALTKRSLEAEVTQKEYLAQPEQLELQRKATLAEIDKITAQTEEARRKTFDARLDELDTIAERNHAEIMENVIGAFGIQESIIQAQEGSGITGTFEKSSLYKNLKNNTSSKDRKRFSKEIQNSIFGMVQTEGKTDDFENMLINYVSASMKLGSPRFGKNLNERMKKLTPEEKKYNKIFRAGFDEPTLTRFQSLGVELLRAKEIEKNIQNERIEAGTGDYKFDINKVSNIKISPQDAQLLDAVIRGGEDVDNIPPSYMGAQGMKTIQQSILNSEKSLDQLAVLYNKAMQAKNPTDKQKELIDEYDDRKDDIVSQIRIQKRVLNRIRSGI